MSEGENLTAQKKTAIANGGEILPGKITGKYYRGKLPENIAGKYCWEILPGNIAGKYCREKIGGIVAVRIQRIRVKFFRFCRGQAKIAAESAEQICAIICLQLGLSRIKPE